MPAGPLVSRSRLGVVATLGLAWLVAASPARAAEPPVGTSFDIWYYKTNEDGERESSFQFSAQDLTQYVNRARCECGQDISTRMQLQRAMTTYDNSIRVSTYVGNRCDQAADNPNAGQARPCVKVLSSSPSAYTLGINFSFEPIWLAGGVEQGSSQDLGTATPSVTCESGEGDGGVWVCIESNGIPDCQGEEFQVQGSQNKNSTMGMAQAIHYDFLPPQVLPSSFEIEEGDGAVVISWNQDASAESGAGFRVLCADANDNPLPNKGLDNPPSLTAVSQGTVYFTKQNLCPDGEFADPNNDLPDDPSTDGGSVDGTDGTDDGGTESGTDGGTTGAGVVEDFEADEALLGGSTGTSGTTDGGTTTGTTETGGTTDGGTGTDGGATTGSGELPSTGIQSLDWDYVCTGHISGTARSARISGLENETEYRFVVVAYDPAGNPSASEVLTATPRETIDLWEQCEAQGDVCGDGGYCACTTEADDRPALALLGLVGLAGLVRRRRRRAR